MVTCYFSYFITNYLHIQFYINIKFYLFLPSYTLLPKRSNNKVPSTYKILSDFQEQSNQILKVKGAECIESVHEGC